MSANTRYVPHVVKLPPRSSGMISGRRSSLTERKRSMKFRPLHNRVVIRRIEGEDKTKGGIIIPDTVKVRTPRPQVLPRLDIRSRRRSQRARLTSSKDATPSDFRDETLWTHSLRLVLSGLSRKPK